jgi:hypothetical protein
MSRFYLLFFLFLVFKAQAQAPAFKWAKTFGGSQYDDAKSCDIAEDGSFFIAGITYSNDGDVTGSKGQWDSWIIKMDSSGGVKWKKCLGGSFNEYGTSIKATKDGGCIFTGMSTSTDGDLTGTLIYDKADFWVVKVDSLGSIQWQKCYGSMEGDIAYSITLSTDNGYFITGTVTDASGLVSVHHGDYDFWTIKTDSVGNLLWEKTIGGTDEDAAFSVFGTADSGCVIAGWGLSENGDLIGSKGGEDFTIIKYSKIGELQWKKLYGGPGSDLTEAIIQTRDKGYIIVGTTVYEGGDVVGVHNAGNDWDAWVIGQFRKP